jgi:hypothetical protein
VPGCRKTAKHRLGVRLRHSPGPNADWAPETSVSVCSTHAKSGAKLTILYQATSTGRIDTAVYGVDDPVTHRHHIK